MAVVETATVTDRSPGGVSWSATWGGVGGGGKDVRVQVVGKLEMDSYLRCGGTRLFLGMVKSAEPRDK